MNLATQYAKALYASKVPDAKRVSGLHAALKRRGHEKLLPRILAEYEKLAEGEQRLGQYRTTTPQKEQTRTLLELYQKLVHHNG